MTWWALSNFSIGIAHNGASVYCYTSWPDECFVAYAPWQPRKVPIYRRYRGVTTFCGWRYVWDTPLIAPDVNPGELTVHRFDLHALTPLTTYWAYVFAPDGPYGLDIQGPLFSFTTLPTPPGPEPTPEPILWFLLQRSIRCGNHYTWWANSTWYAMVPTPDSLTVWKLQGGVMVRRDQAHEPVPPVGFISDGDSRMDNLSETLHCSYFIRTVTPAPHLLRYATFDLTTDLWAIDEPICTPTRSAWAGGDTSLSLDAAQVPHVVYTDHATGIPMFRYRNRIGGVWSASEVAMARWPRVLDGSSVDHDPATNHFHFFCHASHNWCYVNKRSPAGAWDGRTWLDPIGVNLSQHTITTPLELPHFGQIGATWRVNYHAGVFPYSSDLLLSAPVSQFANIVGGSLITFRNAANHLAYVFKSAPFVWDPEVQLAPDGLGILAATYAHPDIVACLWERLGVNNLALYAYQYPT